VPALRDGPKKGTFLGDLALCLQPVATIVVPLVSKAAEQTLRPAVLETRRMSYQRMDLGEVRTQTRAGAVWRRCGRWGGAGSGL
jgi:hypothetical protein